MKNLPKWMTTVTPVSKIAAAVLFIALPFAGFLLGLSMNMNDVLVDPTTSLPSNKTVITTTSPVQTSTPLPTTSIIVTTTATPTTTATSQKEYILTIGKDFKFETADLNLPSGQTLVIKNNSGYSLGGTSDANYLTIDTSLENSPKTMVDTKVKQIPNGGSYSFTYTTPSGGTRLIKVKGACQNSVNCTSSQATITIVAP